MRSFKIIVGTLFGLLISAVVVLGVVSFRYNEQVVNTSYWVNNTYRVMVVTDNISSLFRDLQLESNAIYIERDTLRIRNYRRARNQIAERIKEIEFLIKDNLEQRPLVDSLAALTAQLISFTEMALSKPRTQNVDQDIVDRFNKTDHFRDQITSAIDRIRSKEVARLRLREAENTKSIASFNRAFGQLLAGIGLLVIVAFFSIRYNFNRLIRIDEQLRVAQEKTERALAAEVELNKLKSNFVALASHEFRTPLTTVLSSAALLENYSFGDNQAKIGKHIARIRSSVNSLTSILDEFLSLSKIEEGRLVPNFERLNIEQYLQQCVSNLQSFTKPGQAIHYAHSGSVEVEMDPVFIANIVNNLVTNSIKYSPENSPIYVTSYVGDVIQLSVEDKGIGIPADDQKHLFERFYRASNAGTVHGTGLGLHIMKQYVEMLNGTIEVESEVGRGTRVTITLNPSMRG